MRRRRLFGVTSSSSSSAIQPSAHSTATRRGGVSTAYSLDTIQERGRLFIGAQEEIYEGMIIGENARPDDMPVNPCRATKLTSMRSQGDGKGISLAPPTKMTLERSLEYIAPDEYVEATPKSLRLRKKILDSTLRKRSKN